MQRGLRDGAAAPQPNEGDRRIKGKAEAADTFSKPELVAVETIPAG